MLGLAHVMHVHVVTLRVGNVQHTCTLVVAACCWTEGTYTYTQVVNTNIAQATVIVVALWWWWWWWWISYEQLASWSAMIILYMHYNYTVPGVDPLLVWAWLHVYTHSVASTEYEPHKIATNTLKKKGWNMYTMFFPGHGFQKTVRLIGCYCTLGLSVLTMYMHLHTCVHYMYMCMYCAMYCYTAMGVLHM